MKAQSLRRTVLLAVFAALVLWSAATPTRASASTSASTTDVWTRVRTKNFMLVGNADAGDIRRVGVRLEQFREVFSRLLAKNYFDSTAPTVVIVFRDDASYRPFKPLYQGQPADVAGHFQSSPDIDYVTVSIDRRRGGGSLQYLIAHEYVHLLVKNNFRDAPVWFNEGLAEFYSTLETSDDNRRVTLGKPLGAHMQTLRRGGLLPLESLLEVDQQSPYYNEHAKRSLFYAESWAFVHFLLNGNGGARRAQLAQYLDLLANGTPARESFQSAFHTSYAALENELRAYVTLARYPEQSIRFDREPGGARELESAPLAEAGALSYLGDLLLHSERPAEAESYLERALALDPQLALAQTSLGLLRLRQNRFAEAKEHLRRATLADPQNYLAHYYYASALSREGMDEHQWVAGYVPEAAQQMRAELQRTFELAPRFVDAYRLLAFVNIVQDERLDEALALLKQAQALAPTRRDLTLLLAQIQLRREEFAAARATLMPLAAPPTPEPVRLPAQALLATIPSREEMAARRKAENEGAHAADALDAALQPCDMPISGAQHKRLRFEGEQRCGMLVRVECEDAGVLLFVETGGTTLKLRGTALNRIRFITYTSDVRGQITCGMREPANPVLVTYRSTKDAHANTDGEVIAVEFIPKDWPSVN